MGQSQRASLILWTACLGACTHEVKGDPFGGETAPMPMLESAGVSAGHNDDSEGLTTSGGSGEMDAAETGTATDQGDGGSDASGGDNDTESLPSEADTGTTGSGAEDGSTSSECGNGLLEDGEDCDGAELGNMTCADADPMFTGGILGCSSTCTFDTSACVATANPYQVCQTTNLAIPDNNASGISKVLTLPPEVTGTITDVNVEVELDHTYIGDLSVDVTHLTNTVRVYDRNCTNEDNIHAIFDGEVGVGFNCNSSDTQGTFTSAEPLLFFNDSIMEGDWTLTVRDHANADTGTIHEWCLTITWM